MRARDVARDRKSEAGAAFVLVAGVVVLLHRLDLAAVAKERQLELEAGQDGAQIVRDAGEHGGALLDRALDAALHFDEGGRRPAHLARPARAEIRHLAALAETLGGV